MRGVREGRDLQHPGELQGQGKYPGHLSEVCELSLADQLGQHQAMLS